MINAGKRPLQGVWPHFHPHFTSKGVTVAGPVLAYRPKTVLFKPEVFPFKLTQQINGKGLTDDRLTGLKQQRGGWRT